MLGVFDVFRVNILIKSERNFILIITAKETKKLLTIASGFLKGYTFSLNPYVGCQFSCSYCYVRKMPVSIFRKNKWGSWVDVKRNASEQYKKEIKRARKKYKKITIFMSSSTDPYQPIEVKERITRKLLEAMIEMPPDFLFLQTRSPLVTRDIDLLKKLGNKVMVSMTIETDREDIRKVFSPSAPPIPARLKGLEKLADENIPIQVAIAPVLPSTDSFAKTLFPIVKRVTIDDYFMGDGSGGKRTQQLGIDSIYKEEKIEDWYDPDAYKQMLSLFQRIYKHDQLFISQNGFLPPREFL